MTTFYADAMLTILQGDVRDMLRTLPDESVHCVVTSPPYWGLRDYGVAGQIGLEPSPEAWVAVMVDVFREVRRVLRRDGTVWLNVGDAYVSGQGGRQSAAGELPSTSRFDRPDPKPRPELDNAPSGWAERAVTRRTYPAAETHLKPKDLLMLPARLAQALQRPYYTGRIAREADRAWLAAAIEGEGCIYIQRHPIGTPTGRNRTPRRSDSFGVGLRLATTSRAFVERCAEIAGRGTLRSSSREGQRDYYEWNTWSDDTREVLREIYPYLASKHQEARIAYGAPSGGDLAEASWLALKALHRGSTTEVDFPAPAPLYEPGWYVRSDVIWSKLNPMPESVTDRPTKAHEYVFLLTRSSRYFYDADAVREPSTTTRPELLEFGDRPDVGGTGHMNDRRRARPSAKRGEFSGKTEAMPGRNAFRAVTSARNLRSVWTIATEPYTGFTRSVRWVGAEAGAVGDDIRRTTSPDCPAHGDRPAPATTPGDGGRAGPSEASPRTSDTSDGRVLGQRDEPAATDQTRDEDFAGETTDEPLPSHAPAAIGHSTETHRTDPVPSTTLPCTPSGETSGRTGGRPTPPGSAAPRHGTPANSTAPDDSGAHSPGQTPSRTADMPSCTCSYQRKITESISHFATFPQKLVEPCVKAGTSERGCCPECGAPWERVVERVDSGVRVKMADGWATHAGGHGSIHRDGREQGEPGQVPTVPVTTGWRPTCDHDAEPVPCTVLDPFGGSGTTALVANRHGRRAVLIELNPDYCAQALRRCQQAPLSEAAS